MIKNKKKDEERRVSYSISLDKATIALIEEIAEMACVSTSSVVVNCLKKQLPELKKRVENYLR